MPIMWTVSRVLQCSYAFEISITVTYKLKYIGLINIDRNVEFAQKNFSMH